MSDAAAAAESETGAPGAAPARGKPMVLAAVLLAAVLAGVGGGVVLAPRFAPKVPGDSTAADAEAKDAEGEKDGTHEDGEKGEGGRIIRLDNLIVNPAGSEGTRFLMASVAFEVETEPAEAALKDHEVQLRDLVVATLESQTMPMLTKAGARDEIKRQLAQAVATVLGPKTAVRVYLPQFVIQ